ncbi:hypothetical protein [Lactococcus garvieae]|uniref:hypothetical protein n=1 Tax=Lactococcus garvieae TaxID=1363 RepID=UPI00255169AD|nr:hypothetical protein [Lactococcus garvieae]
MTDKAQEHNLPKYNLDADFWRNRWCEASAEALQQQLKLIKLEKKLSTAVEALEDINNGTWHSKNRGIVVDTSDKGTVNLFEFTEKVIVEIGGKDD